jgi:HEAT repeat protein
MKLLTTLCLTAAVVLVGTGLARSAEPDVAALMREFKGEAEPVKRSAEELTAAYAKVLAALLPDMGSDDTGKRGGAQNEWSRICFRAGRPGADEDREAACRAIAATLGTDMPAAAKVWLIRQLQWIGKAESVAALVTLLDDKDPLVREPARRAVQDNPAPAAGAALVAALSKAGTPAWRIAIINACAARKDPAAVPGIVKALSDKDEAVACAAADGLGKIGGAEAAAALAAAKAGSQGRLQAHVLDDYLLCADEFVKADKKDAALPIYEASYAAGNPVRVRIAALRGLVMVKGEAAVPVLSEVIAGGDAKMRGIALSFLTEMPGPGATRAMVAMLPKLAPEAQVDVLNELGNRGDPATRTAVLEYTKAADEAVRVAALKALGGVGDAADVPALASAAAGQGNEREAARYALDHLRGQAVDQAMVSALDSGEAKVRPELLRAIAARRAPIAVTTLAKYAKDADDATRMEALKGIEAIGDEKVDDLLIDIIAKTEKGEDRGAAERALSAITSRAGAKDAIGDSIIRALGAAGGQAKAALLRCLGKVGGTKAIEPVRAGLKDADAAVQDAALRTLADWPDGAAAADLLTIAQTDPKQTNQVLALRGYVRLITVGNRPVAEKVKMCQEAMAAAKRPDEKRLVLGPLGECKTLDAFNLAAPLLDQEGVKEEAAATTVKIARDLPGTLPPEVKEAMTKVLAVSKNNNVRGGAQNVITKIDSQKK